MTKIDLILTLELGFIMPDPYKLVLVVHEVTFKSSIVLEAAGAVV